MEIRSEAHSSTLRVLSGDLQCVGQFKGKVLLVTTVVHVLILAVSP